MPFALLGLLYGGNDLQETLLAALHCGYDTDCTLATSGALLGQILGARGIPRSLKEPIGNQLVMGISYNREEMTLTALARDTARVGTLLAKECDTDTIILDPPLLEPLPSVAPAETTLRVEYQELPCAAPGETVRIVVHIEGEPPDDGTMLSLDPPKGWTALPLQLRLNQLTREVLFSLYADPQMPLMPMRNLFVLRLGDQVEHEFGVAGGGLWRFLGVYFDPLPLRAIPWPAFAGITITSWTL